MQHDVKLVMGDANANVGLKTVHQPTIGKHSLHESINENGNVASRYYDEHKSELHGVQAQPLSLDEKCKKLEETIQRVATNTTRKQANKEWFDEECARMNEEKNAARERAIQNNTRGAKNAYKLARTKERRLFRKKARQLDEEALIEIERHRNIQDSAPQ
jgi:hypothetical protein